MHIVFNSRATAAIAILAVSSLGAITPSVAQQPANAEQIVFSGTGVPPGSSEPFGFWIWCQNHQATPSHGQYVTDCNGALYFYSRGIVAKVTGAVSEPAEGKYEMSVTSRDGSVACTLDNVPPVTHGPTNTVTASCMIGGESVSDLMSTSAVVNATGP